MDIFTLKSFIPEIFLSGAILGQLIYNVKLINNPKYNFPIISKEVFFQTLFILLCVAYMLNDLKIEGLLSNFSLINDEGTRLTKLILILISAVTLYIVRAACDLQKLNFFEFYSILLLSILSLLIMISAVDLIMFYLAMEMQALCFYVLASFNRNSPFSVEAGLKYFISGSFISGFYLLGCSLIYGALGTLNLHDIALLTSFNIQEYSTSLHLLLLIGIIFITVTLLFKIACAPFHFWAPDVYDGAPIASTVVFSILPKLAIIFFFIKWLNSLNSLFDSISDILLIVGVFSTFLGTFFALNQKKLKRLIIYSSIAQIGFLVAALSINTINGLTAVYFFLIIYLITSILIWGHFVVFYKFYSKTAGFESIEISPLFISSLANLYKTNSIWAFSLAIIFFSISGIPPLAGFLAKMNIISELVAANQIVAALALIVISAVSVYYYIRVIKTVYFESNKDVNKLQNDFIVVFFDKELNYLYIIFVVLLVFIITLLYFPSFLLYICQYIVIHSFGF